MSTVRCHSSAGLCSSSVMLQALETVVLTVEHIFQIGIRFEGIPTLAHDPFLAVAI